MSNLPARATTILIWAVPTIVAIILHEVMHGVVARRFGDDTAAQAGRLSLNPLKHVDPVGTIIMPAILIYIGAPVFGYAKPVPVNFRRLSPQRIGMIAVAGAGPLTNLTLAVVSAATVRLLPGNFESGVGAIAVGMLSASVLINVMLAVFNLLPLLPLDGGRVLAGLLPPGLARSYARVERYGFLILFLLLYTGWINAVIFPVIRAVVGALGVLPL